MADRDLTPDSGHAPPFAKPDPALGAIGTGSGYSGQEHDSDGQAGWREASRAQGVSPDGEAHGSGSPDEEIDPVTPGAQGNGGADEATDSNGQQNVEDRPNVSTVTPDDYPEQQ